MHGMRKRLLLLGLLTTLAMAGGPLVDKTNGFRLTPPPGWQNVPPERGAVLIYMGPDQGNFRANINVMVQPAKSMDDYYKTTMNGLSKTPGAKVLSERKVKAGKLDGYEMIWRAPLYGKNLQFYSRWFYSDGKVRLFTGTSLGTGWRTVEPIFAKSAATFGPP